MNSQFRAVTLQGLSGGALQQVFDRELSNVLANIQDPNTNPKATRKIVLTVEFKPHESREIANVVLKADAKIAPVKEIESLVYLEEDGRALEKIEEDGTINLHAQAL